MLLFPILPPQGCQAVPPRFMANYAEHQTRRAGLMAAALSALEQRTGSALHAPAPPPPVAEGSCSALLPGASPRKAQQAAQQQAAPPLSDTQLQHRPFNTAELRLCLADAAFRAH